MEPQDWALLIAKLLGLFSVFFAFFIERLPHPWSWVWAAIFLLLGLAFLSAE